MVPSSWLISTILPFQDPASPVTGGFLGVTVQRQKVCLWQEGQGEASIFLCKEGRRWLRLPEDMGRSGTLQVSSSPHTGWTHMFPHGPLQHLRLFWQWLSFRQSLGGRNNLHWPVTTGHLPGLTWTGEKNVTTQARDHASSHPHLHLMHGNQVSPTSAPKQRPEHVLKETPSHWGAPTGSVSVRQTDGLTEWQQSMSWQIDYWPTDRRRVQGWEWTSPDSAPPSSPLQRSPLHFHKMHVLKLKSHWSPFPGPHFFTWLWWVYRIQAFDATKVRTAFLLIWTVPVTVALRRFKHTTHGWLYGGAGSMFSFFWRVGTEEGEGADSESGPQFWTRNQLPRRGEKIQVADPKWMQGAVRSPVWRQLWGSIKLRQALN